MQNFRFSFDYLDSNLSSYICEVITFFLFNQPHPRALESGYTAGTTAAMTCPPEMFPNFGRVCFSRGRTNETHPLPPASTAIKVLKPMRKGLGAETELTLPLLKIACVLRGVSCDGGAYRSAYPGAPTWVSGNFGNELSNSSGNCQGR